MNIFSSYRARIKESERVVLTRDISEYGLAKGDLGAIVHVYPSQDEYEVEFVTAEGKTVAVLTLSKQDIRLMHPHEILHARILEAA